LRVKDDEMVSVSPGIVAGVIDKPSADVANVLLTSMKCHMNATLTALFAVLRDENVAGVTQA
jgi:hypothetical protein